MKLSIEYCSAWNYLPQASSLESEIKQKFPSSEITLIPSGGGVFEIVLNGQLTLGQLIAFRIISGYVTQPLLRLSTIWQNIQELKVSFERLADIVDTPEETTAEDKEKIPLPSIEGSVEFKDHKKNEILINKPFKHF